MLCTIVLLLFYICDIREYFISKIDVIMRFNFNAIFFNNNEICNTNCWSRVSNFSILITVQIKHHKRITLSLGLLLF